MKDNNVNFHAGFIGLIGKPNTGKSSILNKLIGCKISISTSKPQTTRNRILGVGNYKGCQAAFLDTPGMHIPKNNLGKFMVSQVKRVIEESDILFFIIDVKTGFTKDDILLFENLKQYKREILLIINKIDLISKTKLLPFIDNIRKKHRFSEYIPVSAKTGENLEELIKTFGKYLPKSPKLFPDEIITDSPEHFIISEIIREEVLKQTHEEIPYSCAVVVNEISYRKSSKVFFIDAVIFLERLSQKKIVIGQKGIKIKNIGKVSRKKLEDYFKKKVYLQLNVNIMRGWQKKGNLIKKLGYTTY